MGLICKLRRKRSVVNTVPEVGLLNIKVGLKQRNKETKIISLIFINLVTPKARASMSLYSTNQPQGPVY
jgi:hypothetical protein